MGGWEGRKADESVDSHEATKAAWEEPGDYSKLSFATDGDLIKATAA